MTALYWVGLFAMVAVLWGFVLLILWSMENRDRRGYSDMPLKMVTITKQVPVADRESLTAWLNRELGDWLVCSEESGREDTAGNRALDLIHEAGFTLNPPKVNR